MSLQQRGPLQLGFIGGGVNSAAGQTHFSSSRLDGRWELVAGAFSRHADVNRRTALAWHVSADRTYDSWRDLLVREKGRLDAIVLLTPTPDHAECLCELLKAGFAVICEKAVASSLEQVKRIRGAYDPQSHFLAVTFNYSGYPLVRELRQWIRRGELGEIQQIHLEMPQEGFVRPPDIAGTVAGPQAWRLKDGYIPTICLDLGVHLHHLTSFLLEEEPSHVMGNFGHYSSYENILDYSTVWLRFPSGKAGSFWFTKTAVGSRNGLRVRVFGSRGSAEWYQMNPEELSVAGIDGVNSRIDRGSKKGLSGEGRYNRMKAGHPSGFIEAFANLYWDLADALLEWRASRVTSNSYVFGLDHAERGLRLFHQARRSHESGAWVEV